MARLPLRSPGQARRLKTYGQTFDIKELFTMILQIRLRLRIVKRSATDILKM
jgi:hypothetical protein